LYLCEIAMYECFTPSCLQTPIMPPSSPIVNYTYPTISTYTDNYTKVDRCFDPYNKETMSDIKDDIIRLSTITEKELDRDNGLIQRIRRLSFFDSGQNKYGILSSNNVVVKDIDLQYSNIYYDIGDTRYIGQRGRCGSESNHLDDTSPFYKIDCKRFDIGTWDIKDCQKVNDIVLNDDVTEVNIRISHDSEFKYNTDVSKKKSISITSIYSNYTGEVDIFGYKFNVVDWSSKYIILRCNINPSGFIRMYQEHAIYSHLSRNMPYLRQSINVLQKQEAVLKHRTDNIEDDIKESYSMDNCDYKEAWNKNRLSWKDDRKSEELYMPSIYRGGCKYNDVSKSCHDKLYTKLEKIYLDIFGDICSLLAKQWRPIVYKYNGHLKDPGIFDDQPDEIKDKYKTCMDELLLPELSERINNFRKTLERDYVKYERNKEEIYKKYGISSMDDVNKYKSRLEELDKIYSNKSNLILIKYTELNYQSNIPEEYKNIPVIIKDKYKRWTGTSKKTNSLYGLIERIHQEWGYHGQLSNSDNRNNVICVDNKYYLNTYNWYNSPPKTNIENVDNIVKDADILSKKILDLMKDFTNKYYTHVQYQEQCARVWNNISN